MKNFKGGKKKFSSNKKWVDHAAETPQPVNNKIKETPVKKILLDTIENEAICSQFEQMPIMEMVTTKKAIICHTDPIRWIVIKDNTFAIVQQAGGNHLCLGAYDVSNNPQFKEQGFRLRSAIIAISKLVFITEKVLENGKVSELGVFAITDQNQEKLKIVMKKGDYGQHPEIEFKYQGDQ